MQAARVSAAGAACLSASVSRLGRTRTSPATNNGRTSAAHTAGFRPIVVRDGVKARPCARPSRATVFCTSGGGVSPSSSSASQSVAKANWSTATVVENRAASADGSVRTLVISVEDDVHFLEGRKRKHVQDGPRWIDAYQCPGQKVHVRLGDGEDGAAERVFALSSSPYASHSASANLAAGIIEIMVEHSADNALDEELAGLAPGALLKVSDIKGGGFASLFNPEHSLQGSLETGRSLLMIAQGTDGIGPLRSALEWTPVQAHATEHSVTLIYLCQNAGAAAYLKDWDSWREAGIVVKPVYFATSSADEKGEPEPSTALSNEDALDKLALAIYRGENGLSGLMDGSPQDCSVLISGLPGPVATGLTKRLAADGVPREWIWRV